MRIYRIYVDYMFDYSNHKLGNIRCYQDYSNFYLNSDESRYLEFEGFFLYDRHNKIGTFNYRNCDSCLIDMDFKGNCGFIINSYRDILNPILLANIRNNKIENILNEVI